MKPLPPMIIVQARILSLTSRTLNEE